MYAIINPGETPTSGLKWVAVARHGLILWENDATGSRKVFKYLPGLREAISN